MATTTAAPSAPPAVLPCGAAARAPLSAPSQAPALDVGCPIGGAAPGWQPPPEVALAPSERRLAPGDRGWDPDPPAVAARPLILAGLFLIGVAMGLAVFARGQTAALVPQQNPAQAVAANEGTTETVPPQVRSLIARPPRRRPDGGPARRSRPALSAPRRRARQRRDQPDPRRARALHLRHRQRLRDRDPGDRRRSVRQRPDLQPRRPSQGRSHHRLPLIASVAQEDRSCASATPHRERATSSSKNRIRFVILLAVLTFLIMQNSVHG